MSVAMPVPDAETIAERERSPAGAASRREGCDRCAQALVRWDP
jgi:hypothetical protein